MPPVYSPDSMLGQQVLAFRNSGWLRVSFTHVFEQATQNKPIKQLWVTSFAGSNGNIPPGVFRRFNVSAIPGAGVNSTTIRIPPDAAGQQSPEIINLLSEFGIVGHFEFNSEMGEIGVQWNNFVSIAVRQQFQFDLEIDSNHPFFESNGVIQIRVRSFWKGLNSPSDQPGIELKIIDQESNPESMISDKTVAIDLGNFATAAALVADQGDIFPSLGVKQDAGVSGLHSDRSMFIFRSGLSLRRVYANSSGDGANDPWFGIHIDPNLTSSNDTKDHNYRKYAEIDYHGRSIQCHDVKRLLASGDAEYDLNPAHKCFDDQGRFVVGKRNHFLNLEDAQNNSFFAPKRVPGELFLTRIFDHLSSVGFQDRRLGLPREIILTYPTSYTTREIVQLSRAVHRAWLRHCDLLSPNQVNCSPLQRNRELIDRVHAYVSGVPQYPSDKISNASNARVGYGPLVPKVIDEATASGIYFIVNKLINKDHYSQIGPIEAFQFRYPDGVRLVVVDIGAGTSDVATLHAKMEKAPNEEKLSVELVNKSGSRQFSGDMITAAIARIIKAKLILASIRTAGEPVINNFKQVLQTRGINNFVTQRFLLAQGRGNQPLITANNATHQAEKELIDFINGVIAAFGSRSSPNTFTGLLPWVDTRRNANDRSNNPNQMDIPDRRQALDWLVSVAEKAKAGLGVDGAGDLWTMGFNEQPDWDIPNQSFEAAIGTNSISVFRSEVDACIRAELSKFAALVNQFLVYQPGSDLCRFNSPADWIPPRKVVLAGRASLYPLVWEMLSKSLCLMDPTHSLVHMHQHLHWHGDDSQRLYGNPEELKVCVTKGALMLSGRGGHGLKIDIKSNLDMLLPYRVLVLIGGQSKKVFDAASDFSKIEPQRFQAFAPIAPGTPVLLQYQLPGDDTERLADLSRHYFEGPNPVSLFFVGCDRDKRKCVVYPAKPNGEPDLQRPAREEPASNKEYESPLYSGEI